MPDVTDINLPGARLSLESAGVGDRPLVLIHGFAGDRRLWDFVWADITAGQRAIRYDLRGFGGSVCLDDGGFRHSQDLRGLLDALGVERCDLAGVSLGASVALNFALDVPERVRKLVLVSPGITGWDWSEPWRALWREIVRVAQAGDVGLAKDLWFAHPLFATTRASPSAGEKLRETLWAYSGVVWTQGDREAAALPDLDRLPLLAVPTLLLTGSKDWADFRLIADLIEAAAPDVRRVDHEGAGHLLNLERPREVAAEILSFLK